MDVATKFAEAQRAEKVQLYRKAVQARIRPAIPSEVVETVIDGVRETVNTAQPGDYVVCGAKGEHYIIKAETLADRYGAPIGAPDEAGYRLYPAQGIFYGFCYDGEPFKFVAPWGEEMIANPGDYIGINALGSNEYCRIEKNAFAATYVAVKN
jgi:hypothetical protein